MQLFTIGLNKLNIDGTLVKKKNGETVLTYTNDDIEEMSRLWTGFRQHAKRGNIEASYNRLDPMDIDIRWRDRFPKMGLDGNYIGEGYPLCADLPRKHFLMKGARYRLADADGQPDLQIDPSTWGTTMTAKRISADKNGGLFKALCRSSGRCKRSPVVVLAKDLSCTGRECSIDTVRTIEVEPGLFYEYSRPPCVHQAFYNDAKKIVRYSWNAGQTMCADPRTSSANSACCNTAKPCCTNTKKNGFMTFLAEPTGQEYWGERMTYKTAEKRCGAKALCFSPQMWNFCFQGGHRGCSNDRFTSTHYWTDAGCRLIAKIDIDGTVAIVHSTPKVDDSLMAKHVQRDTKTYFRVDWEGVKLSDVLQQAKKACNRAEDGALLCNISISDKQVFTAEPRSATEVLEKLLIGGFIPKGAKRTKRNGVTMYNVGSKLSMNTVFEVVDSYGVKQLRKNARSTVSIDKTKLKFKNPVHFISLADEEPRDIHYEIQAALDHYTFHPNVAPFLAVRFAQRFGHSNPSPRFIETIATAFKTGLYKSGDTNFGAGKYGDLEATVAAIVLDRESRDTKLDADPGHGSLVEPLMKVVGTMRSLEFVPSQIRKFIGFRPDMQTLIGQGSYGIPSVFSYFLPEFTSSGSRASAAGLVTPEAQAMTTPTTLNLANGLFSLIRNGHDHCYGGFGYGGSKCWKQGNWGNLSFKPSGKSSKEIIDELATVMTAGRLSKRNRALAQAIYDKTDRKKANPLVRAQQLIISTPEFHSTGVVEETGKQRAKPKLKKSTQGGKGYKATVFLMLGGGYDSWNMLVPSTCSGKNEKGQNVRQQYEKERGVLAFIQREHKLKIKVDKKTKLKQPCSQFVVHDELKIVQKLYNDGDLSFFANTGVLNRPVNKKNYNKETKTLLFAVSTNIALLTKSAFRTLTLLYIYSMTPCSEKPNRSIHIKANRTQVCWGV